MGTLLDNVLRHEDTHAGTPLSVLSVDAQYAQLLDQSFSHIEVVT